MNDSQKLAIISDFHMDINQFTPPELDLFKKILLKEKVTHLHFAGDMSNDFYGLTVPYLVELSAETGIVVTSNLGNHDMVGLTENEIEANDFQIFWFGQTAFVSFAGWYDYSFLKGKMSQKKLENFKKNFYFDRKIHRALDDILTTEKICQQLNDVLSGLTHAKRIIVSMHFVPHHQFIINTRYEKFEKFNAFLGSDRFHEIFMRFPNISDVVFGHIHHRYEPRKIKGIIYHARPLGYTYEWQMVDRFFHTYPTYQIPEMYHLRKRFNAIKNESAWLKFRQSHLKKEFLLALTLFEIN